MNPTRDEILRLLLLMSLKSVDGITDIQVQNILKYSEPFEILEDLQIPYVGYVKSLIADQGSGITTLTFTQADLIDDGGGGWYLPLNLTGTQITAAVKSTNGFAKSGGDVQNVNGFTDNTTQTITVFVLGVESDEPPVVPFKNFAPVNAIYQIGSGPVETLNAGDTINITLPESIIIAFTGTTGGIEYGLVNQLNTFLINEDGGNRVETTPHEWILPSDTTLINIAGVP